MEAHDPQHMTAESPRPAMSHRTRRQTNALPLSLVALLVVAYLVVTITAAVRSEEAHLTEKFGESYPAYRDGRAEPGARRFSFERAWRNREYRALAGFAAVFLLLAARLLMR